MPGSDSVSQKDVAKSAGVSVMTVSRVLRNSPRVSAETKERVLTTAREMGYAPDPLVAQLMERIRQRRHHGKSETIALLTEPGLSDLNLHNYVTLDHVRQRAASHGYRVEEFRIGLGGLSASRVRKILATRNINGVLVSVNSPNCTSSELDYNGLAAATFGFGLPRPSLHRASTNITEGLLAIFERLERRGYSRIGLAITPWADLRAGHTYSGALLHYQQSLPAKRQLPLLLLSQPSLDNDRALFEKWMRKHKPDVLISMHEPVKAWLEQMGLDIPKDIGLVVHDWIPAMNGLAGMDHRRQQVAAAAVDLLVAHLHHHEYGIPDPPWQILIPPRFVDGNSLRPDANEPSQPPQPQLTLPKSDWLKQNHTRAYSGKSSKRP
jgi:LacI family transcriptional regulator